MAGHCGESSFNLATCTSSAWGPGVLESQELKFRLRQAMSNRAGRCGARSACNGTPAGPYPCTARRNQRACQRRNGGPRAAPTSHNRATSRAYAFCFWDWGALWRISSERPSSCMLVARKTLCKRCQQQTVIMLLQVLWGIKKGPPTI